jgi:hypothetical protein
LVNLPLGDYNRNGTVDAADYTVWQDSFGQIGAGLAADGNGSNEIDADDYTVWKSHFGQMAGSGLALPSNEKLSAAVPEPASLVILLSGMVAMWTCRVAAVS